MKVTTKTRISAGLLALAACASAQVASVCPTTDVCFRLNIPANTASSGNGDIFFQISAPTSYEWVALGQGDGMPGANMFLVYASQGGSNVTLSPRTTSGRQQPTLNSNTQVTLLEGSGISNGKMVANVRCSNCDSWSGGSMDFKASNGNWIYAYRSSGGPKNSNSQSASISKHDDANAFQWSFADAKGGSSVNPLLNAAPSGTGSGSPSPTSPSNGNTGITPVSASSGPNQRAMLIAHGVLASLAFVILFPAGAIAVRLASFPGVVWLHAAFQVFAYIVFTAAVGLGIWIAKKNTLLNNHHPIIGLVLFAVLFLQPILGFMHHLMFKKYGSRTSWSHVHIWLGRGAVTLGIINGGLGLKLADSAQLSSKGGMIAYGVIAGLIWLAWVGAIVVGEKRRKTGAVQKDTGSANGSETTGPKET